MRWQFWNPADSEESTARAEIDAKIDRWWRAFATRTDGLDALFHRRSEWNLPEWMAQNLQVIDTRLCWEFGQAVEGPGHRLVITPESERQLRPMVRTLLDKAPKLKGWEFYGYRLPESMEDTVATVKARTGGDLSGVLARVQIGDNKLIDLCFHSPRCDQSGDQQTRNDGFVAAETLLGEEVVDSWIGAIDAEPMPKSRSGLLPLERLAPTVAALIESIRSQVHDKPLWKIDVRADGCKWSGFQIKPPEKEDYPARTDMLVGITPYPEMSMSTFSVAPFYSGRFSRFGETFCYLKIDGTNGLDPSHFQDRGEVEDAVDARLVPSRLGRTIGGGTGRRYSYIDLALVDVPESIPVLRDVLRKGNIANRTWLLFHDAELAEEWVGIWDDTPAPPVAEEGKSSDGDATIPAA
jgi:hypothetical protein